MRVRTAGGSTLCSCWRQLASFYGLADFEGALFDYLPENSLKNVANLGDFARLSQACD